MSVFYSSPWAFLYAVLMLAIWAAGDLLLGRSLHEAAVAGIVAYFGFTAGFHEGRL